jgi:hypothetical protein
VFFFPTEVSLKWMAVKREIIHPCRTPNLLSLSNSELSFLPTGSVCFVGHESVRGMHLDKQTHVYHHKVIFLCCINSPAF